MTLQRRANHESDKLVPLRSRLLIAPRLGAEGGKYGWHVTPGKLRSDVAISKLGVARFL